jgi:hypothetical protein
MLKHKILKTNFTLNQGIQEKMKINNCFQFTKERIGVIYVYYERINEQKNQTSLVKLCLGKSQLSTFQLTWRAGSPPFQQPVRYSLQQINDGFSHRYDK